MTQAIITRDKLEAIRQLQQERGSIRARTDFLARLSHEIRTPMNGVLGMTELLRLTPVSPRQREYLDVIEQSGQLLLHLVNDILEYAKLESGKLTVRPRPFDPRALLDSLRTQFRERAAAGLSLQVTVDPSLPAAITQDPERVLHRGYAWVEDAAGRPIVSAAGLQAGDTVRAVWADGRANATLTRVEAAEALPPRA